MNQSAEVAIIPEKKAPIKLGVTKAALAKLKKQYAKVPDGDTPEGYQAIIEAKRVLVPLRTGVVKEATIQKKAAQDHLNNINKVQNFIVSEIQSIEEPQYAEKKRVDDAAAKKKRDEEEAEERRILAIEDAVESIQELTEGLLNADLETLEKRLNFANKIVITDAVYMEYVNQAAQQLEQVKAQLTNAVTTGKALAEQQAEMDRNQKAQAESALAQKQIDDDRQRLLDNQLAEIERKQKEFDDREAEALRIENERKADIAQQEQEQAEEARLAIEQEEADKQRIIDEQKNADELKARLPDDVKIRQYIDSVIDIVERYKGFITDSHSYVSRTGRKSGDIAVRVPQDKFLEVIAEMGHLGDVKSKHISGEDITEEYIDLTARLNNSERQERRLLEILDMANNTKEVLEVERELWRVRGEIERLTGRIKYLENRVELATIHVSLNEPEPITHSWGIRDALRSAFSGFVSVIRGLIIFVGYALPILILICIGWLVKSRLVPRLKRRGKE